MYAVLPKTIMSFMDHMSYVASVCSSYPVTLLSRCVRTSYIPSSSSSSLRLSVVSQDHDVFSMTPHLDVVNMISAFRGSAEPLRFACVSDRSITEPNPIRTRAPLFSTAETPAAPIHFEQPASALGVVEQAFLLYRILGGLLEGARTPGSSTARRRACRSLSKRSRGRPSP